MINSIFQKYNLYFKIFLQEENFGFYRVCLEQANTQEYEFFYVFTKSLSTFEFRLTSNQKVFCFNLHQFAYHIEVCKFIQNYLVKLKIVKETRVLRNYKVGNLGFYNFKRFIDVLEKFR